jgi:hypothetical protein
MPSRHSVFKEDEEREMENAAPRDRNVVADRSV